MIASQVKKVLLEAMFMGLQHGMKEEAAQIMTVIPMILDDKDDATLCQVLYLFSCKQREPARQVAMRLPDAYQQKVSPLFRCS
ncbi:DUF1039 domain-containing protein [Salmonella enterica]|nr:DUF1039 domain-containing protein [Salmonella enterica]EFQ6618172.1 DUF1039 domain-containing protein [Salmonella enterica]